MHVYTQKTGFGGNKRSSSDPFAAQVLVLCRFRGGAGASIIDEKGHTMQPGTGGGSVCELVSSPLQYGDSVLKVSGEGSGTSGGLRINSPGTEFNFGTGTPVCVEFSYKGTATGDGIFSFQIAPLQVPYLIFNGSGDFVAQGNLASHAASIGDQTSAFREYCFERDDANNWYVYVDGILRTSWNETYGLTPTNPTLGNIYGRSTVNGYFGQYRITRAVRYGGTNYTPGEYAL